MNPILAATLAVSDLGAACDRYSQWFDYRVVETGALDCGIAESLAAPSAAGTPYALLAPACGTPVYIRLIQAPTTPGFRALRTFGWAAIEICIEDVHATHARMADSPFEIIGPPSAISGLPTIHPMQVEGPDGEIVFLTEIKQGGPGSGLPTARAPIDTIFIAVLACRDMAATAEWAKTCLGVTIAPAMEIPYRTISRAFGFPADRLHRITTADHDGEIFLEFDQYPPEATERPRNPGALAPGVAAVTLLHDDLDAITGSWAAMPVRRDGLLYQGRRVGTLKTPDGALMEIVEQGRPQSG